METIKIEKNLRAFLEQEGVLEQFIKNSIELNSKGRWGNEQINSIRQSFIWGMSPENHDFWEELDTKFRKSNITYNEIINKSLKPIVEHIKAQPETKDMGNAVLVLSQQMKGEDINSSFLAQGKIEDIVYMLYSRMTEDKGLETIILKTADFYRENN